MFPNPLAAQPELMAQHCAMAGLVEKAIEYWDTAGRLAVQRSTMAEAAAHFGKALELIASLPKSPQRRSSELSLQLALAGALYTAKGWASPQSGEAYARARELCREAPEGPQLAIALGGAWTFLHNRAEFPAARQLADELVVLSERRNDSDTKLITYKCLGLSQLFRAEFSRALQHLRHAHLL